MRLAITWVLIEEVSVVAVGVRSRRWIPSERLHRVTPADRPRRDILVDPGRAVQRQRIWDEFVGVATWNEMDVRIGGVDLHDRRLKRRSTVAIGQRKRDGELVIDAGRGIIMPPFNPTRDRIASCGSS